MRKEPGETIMNWLKTTVLMAAMTALFLAIGYLLAGEAGLIIALLLAGGMNLFAYWNSDRVVLRMHRARLVDGKSAPRLHGLVQTLAAQAELPCPKVYLIDEAQLNAFATGRNPENAAVAATSGLLRLLSDEELAGVMAHELGHVKHRDTLLMTITATLAGAISMLANFAFFFGRGRNNPLGILGVLLVMILAPIAAALVQMAISRSREYAADRAGAEICGRPLWLADALGKLEQAAGQIDNRSAEENPATAHLFIVNPLHGRRMDSLFSTHPNTRNRIAALRDMAGAAPEASRHRPWG